MFSHHNLIHSTNCLTLIQAKLHQHVANFCQVPILLVQSLIFVSVTPLFLLLYPCNPHIVIIVPLHYYCQVGQNYIVAPWTPIYRKEVLVICIIQGLFIYVMYQRLPPRSGLFLRCGSIFSSIFGSSFITRGTFSDEMQVD